MPSRRLELVPADELKAALADGVRAQHEAGDLQASRDNFERAYRLAERAGDVESMALAALGLAGLWVAERRTVTSTVLLEARLQHVLTLLDPRSPLALRVRTRLAGEADYARGTHAAVLAALDEVRAAGDPELLAEALRIAHHCLLGPEHVTARRELAVLVLEQAGELTAADLAGIFGWRRKEAAAILEDVGAGRDDEAGFRIWKRR